MHEIIEKTFEGLNNLELEALHNDMMMESFQHVCENRISIGIVTRFVGLMARAELDRRQAEMLAAENGGDSGKVN